MTERLWVCHECEMIGTEEEAERHLEDSGHRINQLDVQSSEAIRDQWFVERSQRVAALVAGRAASRREQN